MAEYVVVTTDVENGTTTRLLTDDELRQGALPYHITLSANKTAIINDGVDTSVITAQLVTPPLSDNSQEPVAQSRLILINIDGEITAATLEANGSGTINVTSVAPPTTITVTIENLNSDSIDIEVANAS